jgi:4-carboxymuconolactone decarboxylase
MQDGVDARRRGGAQIVRRGSLKRPRRNVSPRHSTEHNLTAAGNSMDTYYKPEHLPKFGEIAEGNQELADLFFSYYGKVFEDGALTAREKALIALAVAHTVQCPYCIDAYTSECLEKGSDLEQMTEAVHVATAIRGGSSLVHGIQMLEQVQHKMM